MISICMITGLMAAATPAFSSDKPVADKTQTAVVATAETQVQSQAIEVRGIIEKSTAGMFVFDGNQTYYVVPDKSLGTDLDKLAGKVVRLSGTLQKSENGPAILVTQAKEAN